MAVVSSIPDAPATSIDIIKHVEKSIKIKIYLGQHREFQYTRFKPVEENRTVELCHMCGLISHRTSHTAHTCNTNVTKTRPCKYSDFSIKKGTSMQ